MLTKAQRIEITGSAIASRLKSKHRSGLNAVELTRAIEEVADDMHDEPTIAGETLRDQERNDLTGRDWKAICRQASKTLKLIS